MSAEYKRDHSPEYNEQWRYVIEQLEKIAMDPNETEARRNKAAWALIDARMGTMAAHSDLQTVRGSVNITNGGDSFIAQEIAYDGFDKGK